MNKIMKRISLLALTVCSAASMTLGLTLFAVAQEDAPVNLAADSTKWTNTTSFVYSENGMAATNINSSNTYKGTVASNSKIEVDISGTTGNTGWCYAWLIFKQTSLNAVFDPVNNNYSGTFAVIVWGGSTAAAVRDYVDGEMKNSLDMSTVLNGNDTWHPDAIDTKIAVRTKDNESGFSSTIDFYGSGTGDTKTIEYTSSASSALNGDYTFGMAYFGSATLSETATYTYTKVLVEEYGDAAENLAADSMNWKNTTDFSYSENGMSAVNICSTNTYKGEVDANSTINYEISGTTGNTGWCYAWVIFKQKSESIVFDPVNNSYSGTYAVILWGGSATAAVRDYVDGEMKNSLDISTVLSGNDTWHPDAIETKIKIKTVDNESGFSATIDFYGSGTGDTKTIEYTSSASSALNGNYTFGMGYFGSATLSETGLYVYKSVTAKTNPKEVKNYATDSSRWSNNTDYSYTADGMSAINVNASNALIEEVKANSTISFNLSGNTGNTSWCYQWIIFKQTSETVVFDPVNNNYSGNFAVLLWGASTAATVKDYVNGEMKNSYDLSLILSGNDTWHPDAIDTNIIITTTDNEKGFSANIIFIGSGTGETKNINYTSSASSALNGNYKIGMGYFGTAVVDETHYFRYTSITVVPSDTQPSGSGETDEPEEFEPAIHNYSLSRKNFEGGINRDKFSFADDGAVAKGISEGALTLKGDVKADAEIAVDFNGKATSATAGYIYIIFKDMSKTPVVSLSDEVRSGTYMALRLGSDGVAFEKVVNGVLDSTDLSSLVSVTAVYKQRIRVKIVTQDVENGVKVTLTILNLTEESTYSTDYEVSEVAFKGNYQLSVGYKCEVNANETIAFAKIGVTEITTRADRSDLYNMAVSNASFKSAINGGAFKFRGEGMSVEGVTEASAMLYNKLNLGSVLSVDFENNLGGTYGNCYMMFNADRQIINLSVPITAETAVTGNWLTLMFGGDGLYVYEAKNGVLSVTAIADYVSNDVWKWFSQKVNVTYKFEETETGVKFLFTLMGESETLTHCTYETDNAELKKALNVSFKFFLHKIGDEDEGSVFVRRMNMSDIATFTAPEIDVEAINASVSQYIATGITRANYTQAMADCSSYKELAEQMNYPQTKAFDSESYGIFSNMIDVFNQNLSDADAVDTLIAALASEVNAENYQTVKADYAAALLAFNALDSKAQGLTTKAADLTAIGNKIAEYEKSLESSSEPESESAGSSESEKTSDAESKKSSGCTGAVAANGILLGLAAVAVSLLKKRKE